MRLRRVLRCVACAGDVLVTYMKPDGLLVMRYQPRITPKSRFLLALEERQAEAKRRADADARKVTPLRKVEDQS